MSISDKQKQSFVIKDFSNENIKASLLFKIPIIGRPDDTNTVFLITGLSVFGADACIGCCLLSISSHTSSKPNLFNAKVEWLRNESNVSFAYKIEEKKALIYAKYSVSYIGRAYAMPLKIGNGITWELPMQNLEEIPDGLTDIGG